MIRRACCALALMSLALPASAVAHEPAGGTGGASVPQDPEVAQAICEDSTAWECSRGARLTIEGESLSDVRQVRFVGGRGTKDDRVARPQSKESHAVEVLVPRSAR